MQGNEATTTSSTKYFQRSQGKGCRYTYDDWRGLRTGADWLRLNRFVKHCQSLHVGDRFVCGLEARTMMRSVTVGLMLISPEILAVSFFTHSHGLLWDDRLDWDLLRNDTEGMSDWLKVQIAVFLFLFFDPFNIVLFFPHCLVLSLKVSFFAQQSSWFLQTPTLIYRECCLRISKFRISMILITM